MSDATTIDVTNQAPAPRVVATIESCPEWCAAHSGGLDAYRTHESALVKLPIAEGFVGQPQYCYAVAEELEGVEFGKGAVTRDHTRFRVADALEGGKRGSTVVEFDNAAQMRDFAAGLNALADSIGGAA